MGLIIRQAVFKDLEHPWKRLYRSNKYLSPYASFEYNEIFIRNYRFGVKRALLRTRFYELSDDHGHSVMIIPLYGIGKRFYIFGDLAATGYLDFIYDDHCTCEVFTEGFALLGQKLPGCTLIINELNEKSLLDNYLSSQYQCLGTNPCVNIAFGSDYDTYFKSLAKGVRQNIRTSRNRLEREILPWRVDVLMDEPLSLGMKRDILRVYNKRTKTRYGINVNLLRKILRQVKNPITISTACMPDNFNAVLRIRDKVVAFLSGYVSNDGSTVIVPRHAIDADYSCYGIGTLLISETIRWLASNTGIRNLDLSRGAEKYKFALGGTGHNNHSYEIHF